MRNAGYFHSIAGLACLVVAASCSANAPGQDGADCAGQRNRVLAVASEELLAADAAIAGDLGACIGNTAGLACNNGDSPMAMQSVMKLLVAIAVFDRADAGALALDELLVIEPGDLSVEVQPLAELVLKQGSAQFSVLDLVRRMVTESDSAATDLLIERLGGPKAVEAIIARTGTDGIRIDRYERELQTELSGLVWQPAYANPAAFAAARNAVPPERRLAAQAAAASDPRDRATPRALALLLSRLADGTLLKPESSRRLIAIMEQTRTFPDRLRGGVPLAWRVAHKTGTSRTVGGVTATTADVGILTAPDGTRFVAVALLSGSAAPAAQRAGAIAQVAGVAERYHSRLGQAPACLARDD